MKDATFADLRCPASDNQHRPPTVHKVNIDKMVSPGLICINAQRCKCYCYCKCFCVIVLLLSMPSVIFNAFRDAIYHSMNDRGVYLPDDYNSDAPPAQVILKVVSKNIFGSMKLYPNATRGLQEHLWFHEILSKCNQCYRCCQRTFSVP